MCVCVCVCVCARTLILEYGDKVQVAAEDGDEEVMRGRDDRRQVCCTRGLALGLKEVVTHRPTHHTAPVLLHKYLPASIECIDSESRL